MMVLDDISPKSKNVNLKVALEEKSGFHQSNLDSSSVQLFVPIIY